MDNFLIIKMGAPGDVVRTTSLLNALEGNIYWITTAKNKYLLPDGKVNLTVLTMEEAYQSLKGIKFTQVISLEENIDCAKLACKVNTEDFVGICYSNGKISYTDSSAYWFDMSRVSKLGLKKANELKMQNIFSYQECVFKMISKKFEGEPYCIYADTTKGIQNKLIGIEKRAGNMWPDKQWWGYDELISRLQDKGNSVKIFTQQNTIRDYLQDIAECNHIVSGDTLAMHVALAYKKTCTAIFNCTPPQEIYDYGLLRKVISPLLSKYLYSNSFDKEVIESVSVDDVYKTLSL
jgi:heptosyltransferase-2